jgi:hypothetical protein
MPENIQNSLDISNCEQISSSKKRERLLNRRASNKSIQLNVTASTNKRKNKKHHELSLQTTKTKPAKNHSSLMRNQQGVVGKSEENFEQDETDIDMKDIKDGAVDSATSGHVPDSIKNKPISVQSGRHHQLLLLHRTDGINKSQNLSENVTNLMGCQKEDCTLFVSNLDRTVTLSDVKTLFHDALGLVEVKKTN